jgi:hypothetical protein
VWSTKPVAIVVKNPRDADPSQYTAPSPAPALDKEGAPRWR